MDGLDGPPEVIPKYEILLGQYRNHTVMGAYLQGNNPDFDYLMQLLDMLETEERIMVKVAFALYQENVSASVRELLELSDVMFDRVIEALRIQRTDRFS
jgi:hypothetical protein